MVFTKRLREGIKQGRITCSVRFWSRRQVKVGGRYPMDEGQVVIDAVTPITLRQVTAALARRSGFASRDDLLGVARHGTSDQIFLVQFHYLPPGASDRRTASLPRSDGARSGKTRTPRANRADPFDRVRDIGRTLAGVEEGTSYGSPALKLGGRMVACLASHRSAEPDTLVVHVDPEQRAALLAEAPDTYYLTDHYVAYPSVLVRLAQIQTEALRDLLRGAVRQDSAGSQARSGRPGQRRR